MIDDGFINGMGTITGEIYSGPRKGQILIGIDCDNRKAIQMMLEILGTVVDYIFFLLFPIQIW
ncbi:MAG: hypothetical protein WAK17_10040 [Candidatus Nitrosopolaris sp.]|jgi:hypothetical protein